ncbi:MAG: cation:proton antiporter [Myxococcota bacterium]
MVTAHDFLVNLALVLCVAALATVVFQRIRQPVVLGYILAGLIVGPHVPIPLVADHAIVEALAELGVILLMFSIGLEFRLGKLTEVAHTSGVIAVVEVSLMACLGYLAGRAFGWTPVECLFTGAIVSISSTSIIAKAFDEQRVQGRRRDVVFGVLIVEDLLAILMMAGLTILASGRDPTVRELGTAALRLGAALAGLLVVGLLVVPRLFRAIVALGRPETTTVAAVGLCFAVALASQALGYSVALGAFLAGMLVAESGHGHDIERQVQPVRDVFAAIFFVAVGMLIDPALIVENWAPVVALTVVVLVGKVFAVSVGAFLVGTGMRGSVSAGMSLAQIGEFSFILAALGLSLGAIGKFLYPVAIAVSAITAFTTPAFIRAADRVADRVDHKLPAPLQTLTALYASWLEQLRGAPPSEGRRARVRAIVRIVLLDAIVLIAIAVSYSLFADEAAAWVSARLGLAGNAARWGVGALSVAIGTPVCLSLVRAGGRLGDIAAEVVVDGVTRARMPAVGPTLVAIVRMAVVLVVGLPVVAATQPFLPTLGGSLVLIVLVLLLALQVWLRASDLQGELRSGAEVLFDSLRRHAGAPDLAEAPRAPAPEPGALQLAPGDAAIGRTLVDLNLRSRTGATVLAITRKRGEAQVPHGREVLEAGDTLALAGTREAIEAAVAVLRESPADDGAS